MSTTSEAADIWYGLVEAERAVRYCDKLRNRSRHLHRLSGALLTGVALFSATPLITPIPDFIASVFFFAVAVIAIWCLHSDYGAKAASLRSASSQFKVLRDDWGSLWSNPDASQVEIDDLWGRYTSISNMYTDIDEDDNINKVATDEADRMLVARYS